MEQILFWNSLLPSESMAMASALNLCIVSVCSLMFCFCIILCFVFFRSRNFLNINKQTNKWKEQNKKQQNHENKISKRSYLSRLACCLDSCSVFCLQSVVFVGKSESQQLYIESISSQNQNNSISNSGNKSIAAFTYVCGFGRIWLNYKSHFPTNDLTTAKFKSL